jgi:hypothetical protein
MLFLQLSASSASVAESVSEWSESVVIVEADESLRRDAARSCALNVSPFGFAGESREVS